MLERVGRLQSKNQRVEIKSKLLDDQGSMAGAVEAVVATVIILVLFQGGAWALVRFGNFRRQCLIACSREVTLHGMRTFMHAIDRHGQHDHQQQPGKELYRDKFSHG